MTSKGVKREAWCDQTSLWNSLTADECFALSFSRGPNPSIATLMKRQIKKETKPRSSYSLHIVLDSPACLRVGANGAISINVLLVVCIREWKLATWPSFGFSISFESTSALALDC